MPGVSGVAVLTRLVHPKEGHRKIFAMLQAYMDDSGTHSGSPICVLAGYFGGERQWVNFDKEWSRVLRNVGVEEFHAKRFWGKDREGRRLDEYEGWSDEKVDMFLGDLLRTITSYRIYPIGSAVVMREWLTLHELERRYLTGGRVRGGKIYTSGAPNKPYFLPFIRNVGQAANYCAEYLKIHFAFDRNEPYSGYALDYFRTLEQMKLPYWRRVGDLTFPTSAEMPALQAADLLAYQTYRYAQERLDKGLETKYRTGPILTTALLKAKNLRQDFKLFDKRGLDIVLQKFRKVFHDRLNHDANAKDETPQ